MGGTHDTLQGVRVLVRARNERVPYCAIREHVARHDVDHQAEAGVLGLAAPASGRAPQLDEHHGEGWR